MWYYALQHHGVLGLSRRIQNQTEYFLKKPMPQLILAFNSARVQAQQELFTNISADNWQLKQISTLKSEITKIYVTM